MIRAIVNPAAGGGRCGKRAGAVLDGLREKLELEAVETAAPGDATRLAREGYDAGVRRFLSVGGDGTAFEVVNGLLPGAERVALGFLPLGTGNSFLRDFSDRGAEHAVECVLAGRTRPCDVVRVTHDDGEIYSINLFCLGFPADVAAVTNRRFKGLGAAGYVLGVLACLARLPRRSFPLRADGGAPERERCLFLSFSNSKYTGGRMKIAPHADTADGLVEFVRLGPIGRFAVLRSLPKLFDGTHVDLPQAARRGVRRVEFDLEGPVDVMVDGEVLTLRPRVLEVLPAALDVLA